jgi:hypothetical protein
MIVAVPLLRGGPALRDQERIAVLRQVVRRQRIVALRLVALRRVVPERDRIVLWEQQSAVAMGHGHARMVEREPQDAGVLRARRVVVLREARVAVPNLPSIVTVVWDARSGVSIAYALRCRGIFSPNANLRGLLVMMVAFPAHQATAVRRSLQLISAPLVSLGVLEGSRLSTPVHAVIVHVRGIAHDVLLGRGVVGGRSRVRRECVPQVRHVC